MLKVMKVLGLRLRSTSASVASGQYWEVTCPIFLNLSTPETWTSFCERGATITGFRKRHRSLAGERVREGDIFL